MLGRPRLVLALGALAALAAAGCRDADLASGSDAARVFLFGGRNWPSWGSDDDEPSVAAPLQHVRPPPTGEPPRLTCTQARALLDDVGARLAAPAPPLPTSGEAAFERGLVDATLDWADPHGLWTASPDAPLAALLRARAHRLREVIEGKGDCAAELRPLGEAMARWTTELRALYDAAASDAAKSPVDERAFEAAITDGAFEDGPVTRPARELARELGRRTAIALAHDPALASAAALGRDRWLPPLDADGWSEVLLAAAVRAYVPLLDPHGAWAPNDESSTLYDRDLEIAPPARLWASSTRTVLGVRLDADPIPPLREKDLVLSIDGVALAGLSAEAIEQLAEAPEGSEHEPRTVRVVRAGESISLDVKLVPSDEPDALLAAPLRTETIAFGGQRALRILITDVPDGLGDDLSRTLAEAAADAKSSGTSLAGVILDLRGNGGGSIEGATGALGVFLPGAPLFPLKHRDGAIETERAAEPPLEDRWNGPVAALVDAGTASAAEMIAGGLHAYRRGLVVGGDTYGKGCAQEYVDDATATGVLRVTTLLFALPDGSAVQRIGLHPDVALPLPRTPGLLEHEADLPRAPPSWVGPDVRDPKRIVEVAWPAAKSIGPCADPLVCKAARALASNKTPVAKK